MAGLYDYYGSAEAAGLTINTANVIQQAAMAGLKGDKPPKKKPIDAGTQSVFDVMDKYQADRKASVYSNPNRQVDSGTGKALGLMDAYSKETQTRPMGEGLGDPSAEAVDRKLPLVSSANIASEGDQSLEAKGIGVSMPQAADGARSYGTFNGQDILQGGTLKINENVSVGVDKLFDPETGDITDLGKKYILGHKDAGFVKKGLAPDEYKYVSPQDREKGVKGLDAFDAAIYANPDVVGKGLPNNGVKTGETATIDGMGLVNQGQARREDPVNLKNRQLRFDSQLEQAASRSARQGRMLSVEEKNRQAAAIVIKEALGDPKSGGLSIAQLNNEQLDALKRAAEFMSDPKNLEQGRVEMEKFVNRVQERLSFPGEQASAGASDATIDKVNMEVAQTNFINGKATPEEIAAVETAQNNADALASGSRKGKNEEIKQAADFLQTKLSVYDRQVKQWSKLIDDNIENGIWNTDSQEVITLTRQIAEITKPGTGLQAKAISDFEALNGMLSKPSEYKPAKKAQSPTADTSSSIKEPADPNAGQKQVLSKYEQEQDAKIKEYGLTGEDMIEAKKQFDKTGKIKGFGKEQTDALLKRFATPKYLSGLEKLNKDIEDAKRKGSKKAIARAEEKLREHQRSWGVKAGYFEWKGAGPAPLQHGPITTGPAAGQYVPSRIRPDKDQE